MILFRIIGIVIILGATGIYAQWRKISIPQIESNPRMQVITYKSGKLWAATQDTLRMTSDDGATWHVRMPEDSIGSIQAIDFFDEQNGIITTKRNVWRTRDGGMSWDSIFVHVENNTFAAKFVTSPSEIAIGLDDSVQIFITRDGGATWGMTDFNGGSPNPPDPLKYNYEELKDIQTTATGTIRALLLRKSSGGSQIATSRDYGSNWTFSSGFDYDCFSFAVDLCDSATFYVINEEVFEPWDRTAMFYRSTDAGATWRSYLPTRNLNYFTGSLSVSPGNVIYLQTAEEGILRSSNGGVFWSNSGGPNGITDTRLICAVTDDIVYAADNQGKIWKTENGGGYPGGNMTRTKLELSEQLLFGGARASICGDTLLDTLILSYPDCPPISFSGASISGSINDYTIIRQSNDTIIVRFVPGGAGKRYADLVLLLNSSTKQIVPLVGTGFVPDFILTSFAPSLFEKDSVLLCDTIIRGLRIRSEGCIIPDVSNQYVTGIAFADYKIITQLPQVLTGDDSITISFVPNVRGVRRAFYTIRFADGKMHSIPLAGVGIDPGSNLATSKAALFDNDSVALCTSVKDTFIVHSSVCANRIVARQQIVGAFANEYSLERAASNQLTGFDSIIITFTPNAIGMRDAVYELVASDSSRISVALWGRAFDEGYLFTTSRSSLFEGDTMPVCGAHVTSQFVIFSAGCIVPDVASEVITGSAEYALQSSLPRKLKGNDTVTISFTPSAVGSRNATYEVILADGRHIVIPLKGTGSEAPYILTITPQSVFDSDSLFTCETLVRQVTISKAGCTTVLVTDGSSTGAAASDYSILQTPLDSLTNSSTIRIEFHPSENGPRTALYTLTLADGKIITIPLLGYGRESLPLTLMTQPEFTMDTLGGMVSIPITIAGLDQPRSVELSITFDNTNLAYLGSRSASGLVLDIPGEKQLNSSRLYIPAAEVQPKSVTAYADFLVFADTAMQSRVFIGDLKVLDAPLPCYYITQTAAESGIAGPEGCDVTIISKYLRTHKTPKIRVYPNPATGYITVATSEDIGNVRIEVANQLGIEKKYWTVELMAASPIQLDIDELSSGLYFVRLNNEFGRYLLPVIVEK